ncbi:MAG: aldo/keto reductase [Clostridia bacterium]|nr:aldo/keto reductase [Bacillota bacterium]MBO2521681.1 aldo/keto reductase [Bacillota bacterium]
MEYRRLGSTELEVSAVSFGTWAIGGDWGPVDEDEAVRAIYRAIDLGVNFFDTADIYGGGRSEELLRKTTADKADEIFIATKFCRAGDLHDPANYSEKQVREYCEGSLKRLGRERIDLYQIHCPPTEILRDGSVFEVLDKLQQEGKIRYYGVSVESVEEALICMEYPGVRALQVIFNIFRQKLIDELFPVAKEKGVGLLARVPLASGLLTGKFTKESRFAEDDHRNYNRDGQAFNVGETFAGLPFEKGVELADQLRWIAEGRGSMARAALRWILEFDAVSCVIPGFKTVAQVEENVAALDVPGFSPEEMARLARFYRDEVAQHIRGPY